MGPIDFLTAAALNHPAAPYVLLSIALGVLSIAIIPFDIRLVRNEAGGKPQPPPTPHRSAASLRKAVASSQIECVPLLDAAHCRLLEVLEDLVEPLGQAQLVLPNVPLAQTLRICSAKGSTGNQRIADEALANSWLDFGVFSYSGTLQLAVFYLNDAKIIPQDARKTPTEIALAKAGVPVMKVSSDYSVVSLQTQLSALLVPAQMAKAA